MPVANPQGFFHQEAPLEFDDIADLQEIETGDADLAFMRKYEYKGVLLVEIVGRPNTTSTTGAVKRQRVEFRAVVLGESQLKPGEMILLHRPGKIFQTVYGMELKQKGGITTGNVHWCSGLQIKVDLAKDLYSMIENEDLDWEDIDWDEIEAMIEAIGPQLDTINSPKKRQRSHKGNKGANKQATARKLVEVKLLVAEEDWTLMKHVVINCGFKVEESDKLGEKEREEVKDLMSKYIADEAEYLDEEMHNRLTELLNKGWTSQFDIQILEDFAKARSVNDDIYSLPTFASFAAWWEIRDACKLSSRSLSQDRSPSPFRSPSLPGAAADPEVHGDPQITDNDTPQGYGFLWQARRFLARLIYVGP
ncbi:MAG: Zf-UBP-domain-containing protein [Aureobasidium pullulans]|nr:MAG: Zf-UBP-domain-containing protein [Aureobasidium pullulans]